MIVCASFTCPHARLSLFLSCLHTQKAELKPDLAAPPEHGICSLLLSACRQLSELLQWGMHVEEPD